MPIAQVKLRPGIRADWTSNLNEGGWSSSAGIRWREGLPEKLGGWTKYWPNALGSAVLALHAWQDLNATDRLAVGGTGGLGIITSGLAADITPQIKTTNFAPQFTTAIGSAVVTITDAGISDVTTYNSIYFNTPVAVGGLVLAGLYPITLITGTHSYQITAGSNATANVTNGGAVPTFDAVSGTSKVTVNLTAHNLVVDGKITLPLPTAVGGVTIYGTYTIVTVPTADTLTITADTVASSTATVAMNSANAQLDYYINLGPAATGAGYGLGTYGTGGYGTGVIPPAQVGSPITATGWSLDNWGKTLLSCPENGGLYAWDPDGGFVNSTLISTPAAPLFNAGMFIAQPAQILVAYGSTTQAVPGSLGVYQDPMLVRWSDQDNYGDWSISTVDQVGSVRLPRGSKIVSGLQGPNQALLWTDLGVWSMMYVGQPLVFAFNELSSGCGLVAKYARTALRGLVYWMSQDNFYVLSGGGVSVLPCTVWDTVFQDLDTANQDKCWAWSNSLFNEVWFFYPSLADGTGQCSRYAKVNVLEAAWDSGPMARSIGIDQSVLGPPIAGTSTGLIYQHESGVDADGAPIEAYVESGDFMVSEGTYCAFVDQIRPDMRWGKAGATTAQLSVTITVTNDITGQISAYGPYSYSQATPYLTVRCRGHRMRVKIASNDVGTWWRLGNMRYRGAVDGRV